MRILFNITEINAMKGKLYMAKAISRSRSTQSHFNVKVIPGSNCKRHSSYISHLNSRQFCQKEKDKQTIKTISEKYKFLLYNRPLKQPIDV